MDKFRTSAEVVTLEVNDAGDVITLPVSDERFIKNFYEFIVNVQHKAEEYETLPKEATDFDKIGKDVEFHEYLREEFIKMFGEGSYDAVFGKDLLVGAEYVFEFVDACTPYIEKHTKKRIEKLSKYNANRQGSSL